MTIDEIEARLKYWAALHETLAVRRKILQSSFGWMGDSPLMRVIDDLWEAYTEAIGEIVGDTDEWLEWYEPECDMGHKQQHVRLKLGGPLVKVRTLKQLAKVIHG